MATIAARHPYPDPTVRWTFTTESPLAGVRLARESGQVLAWDISSRLYLIDAGGGVQARAECPEPIVAAAISETGEVAACLVRSGGLVWLGAALDVVVRQPGLDAPLALTLDTHGTIAVVSSAYKETRILRRQPPREPKKGLFRGLASWKGRAARDRFETRRALAHLALVPSEPHLIGCAEQGLLGRYDLEGEPLWEVPALSNTGDMVVAGDGRVVLLACFLHGIQRHAGDGAHEGAYHFEAGVSRIALTYGGERMVAATMEGELAWIDLQGHVLWQTRLGEVPIGVACDALGRYAVYGLPSGEIVRLDTWKERGGKRGR